MTTLQKNILDVALPHNGRVLIAPTKTKDVVTIEGSVLGGGRMMPNGSRRAAALTARLLDAGTARLSKDALREALAARGVSLSFSSGDHRTYFSATCLPEDLSFTLSMIGECLGTATLPNKELATAKARMLGSLKESKTDTGSQASRALSQLIYDESHENYVRSLEASIKETEAITRAELVRFRSLLGQGGLVLAITGDIDSKTVLSAAKKVFSKLPIGTLANAPQEANAKPQGSAEKLITIADKANVDVFLGATVPLTYDDEQYLAFTLAVDMLGGGFADYLMQTVRERDGLTYGIRSFATGFGDGSDGYFLVRATFSPDLYEKGVATTRREIAQFFKKELTAERLSMKKDDIAGSYAIGLSTTDGLAGQLHSMGVRGKELAYIDEYPERVRALTLEQVQQAAKLIPLDRLSLAAAGTFPKK